MALFTGAIIPFMHLSVSAQGLVYPESGGKKVKTLQTKGEFTKTKVDRGLNYYFYQSVDEISGAPQTVYVTEIDLDCGRYNVVFHYGGDSTSAAAIQYGAVAAINATYETDASYIRSEGKNHHEVTIPSGHLRFWKHNGAIVGDGGNRIAIVNGAPGQEAAPEGGEKAIALYKSLSEPNVFSSAPMLIDDYDLVGARYVPEELIGSDFKQFKYEDYRRHQGVRHPRVAVALTEDNDLLLIVVDGRNPKASGMSARELTLFIARHFNPRWALNMDGGGSSTMYIKGLGDPITNVLNYPTDNKKIDHYGQRRICSHILVTRR
ncbi:MAG: phosphodiester glycosidase family protein [Bacteroidales bacterium]|nr:phosphodiester glycosidase family protein [Bacteroidales bacterium]